MKVGDRVQHRMAGICGYVTSVDGFLATSEGLKPTCSVKYDNGVHLSISLQDEWEVVSKQEKE